MPNCTRCNSAGHIIKSGIVGGKQRYCCKARQYHFVLGNHRTEKGYRPETEVLAVLLAVREASHLSSPYLEPIVPVLVKDARLGKLLWCRGNW